MATYVEASAGGSSESAVVRVDTAGAVTVSVGTQSSGQGHETSFQQIVAEHLGVPAEGIVVVTGDSDRVARGGGTAGSRSLTVGGAAIAEAALKVQEQARAKAAELMEAATADIALERGRFTIVGTDRSLSLAEVAATMDGDPALEDSGRFKPRGATYPNGAHVCEIEIDLETGEPEVVRYTVVDDVGRVMYPLLLEGQVHGGVAQGIGQALHEHTVFDAETGQLLTGSFLDYAMPRAAHLPFLTFRANEVPCATNPLGVKGAGEAGAIGAPPAVINAVIDALSGHGVAHVDMPARAETLWRLIQGAHG